MGNKQAAQRQDATLGVDALAAELRALRQRARDRVPELREERDQHYVDYEQDVKRRTLQSKRLRDDFGKALVFHNELDKVTDMNAVIVKVGKLVRLHLTSNTEPPPHRPHTSY